MKASIGDVVAAVAVELAKEVGSDVSKPATIVDRTERWERILDDRVERLVEDHALFGTRYRGWNTAIHDDLGKELAEGYEAGSRSTT